MRAIIIAAAMLFAPLPSRAAQVTIDHLNKPLLDATGHEAQDCDRVDRVKDPQHPFCDQYATLTFGRLIAAAVDMPEQNLGLDEITQRGRLAREIRKAMTLPPLGTGANKLDVDPRDIDLIRKQLPKTGQSNAIIDQVMELLQAPPAPPK